MPYLYGNREKNDNISNFFILHFHDNTEDFGKSYNILEIIRSEFKINIISMEFPGYGIYKDVEPSEE